MKKIYYTILIVSFSGVIILFSCNKDKLKPIEKDLHPVSNAGKDRLVILPVNSIELIGSGTDADGYIVTYEWRYVSGPSSFTLINPADATVKVKDMVRGIYEFELKVTDNSMLFNTSRAQVLVLDSLNDPLNTACMGCWDYHLP